MKTLTLSVLLVALCSGIASAQDPANFPVVPVCDVRADNDGNCYSDTVGDTVCVTGVVLAWHDFGLRGPGALWDPNGCWISIYDIENEPYLAPGTVVKVCGWVDQFSGLDEITDNPADGTQDPVVTVLSPNPAMFPISPITPATLADNSPTAEFLESSLVFMCGTFADTGTFSTSSANYLFVDTPGDTITVRIDSDTDIAGTPIPVGPVSVRGVVSQFDSFNGALCTGYQLLPRNLGDFTLGCTVAVEETNWGVVKQLFRD